MNFYQTLGIPETATQEEIKRAYRKLATQHHPDKGGSTAIFQSIAQAYETLSDISKKVQYDAQLHGSIRKNQNINNGNINDFFRKMQQGKSPFEEVFRAQRAQQIRKKNRDLNIKAKINLKQSYTGTILEATYQTPSGKKKHVSIKVPEGVKNDQTIRYQGLGDDSNPNLLNGDLIVTILVEDCKDYTRRDNDLLVFVPINPCEAMVGCIKSVTSIDGNTLNITIRPGIQHGTEYMAKGLGFSNHDGSKGNLVAVINIQIPAITDLILKEKLENLYDEINLSQQ